MFKIFSLMVATMLAAGIANASEFKVSIVPNTLNLIDGEWYKCGSLPADRDLQGMYFTSPQVRFSWVGENNLILQEIKVHVNNPEFGQKQIISLSMNELVSMFSKYTDGDSIVLKGRGESGFADQTSCGLRVGGVGIGNPNIAKALTAEVSFRGIEVDPFGNFVGRVNATQILNIQYEP